MQYVCGLFRIFAVLGFLTLTGSGCFVAGGEAQLSMIDGFQSSSSATSGNGGGGVVVPPVGTPILTLADPTTASAGFARQASINVNIAGDANTVKWCLSETQSTEPAVGAPCVGGSGLTNGWHSSRPGAWTLSGGDGPKTLFVWIADASGACNSATVSAAITLDTAPPAVPAAVLSDPNTLSTSLTNQGTVALAVTGDTGAAQWCALETSSAAASPAAPLFNDPCWVGTRPVAQALGTLGTRKVWLYTQDPAGNVSTSPATATIDYSIIHAAAPMLTLSEATSFAGYARARPITIAVSGDPTAVRWCVSETQSAAPALGTSVCTGGAGSSNGWYTVSPTSLTLSNGDGVKTVYAWYADAYNNVNLGTTSATIVLDTVPPAVPSVTMGDTITLSTAFTNHSTVNLNITGDTGATAWCVYETAAAASAPTAPLYNDGCWVTPRPFGQLLGALGSRKVWVYTRDVAGNVSTSAATAVIDYATAAPGAPALTLTDPTSAAGYARGTTVSVGITADATAVRWCVSEFQASAPNYGTSACNGGSGSSGGWYTSRPTSLLLTGGDGAKAVHLWVADSWNNVSSADVQVTITLDTVPPAAFSITGATGGADSIADNQLTAGTTVTANWTASSGQAGYDVTIFLNDGVTVKCGLQSVAAGATSATFGLCSLAYGVTYKIGVVARDAALNTATPALFPFTMWTPAVLGFNSPAMPSNIAYKGTQDVTFTVSNSGTGTATGMSFTGLSVPFTANGGTCGASLAGGGTCTYIVRFTSLGQGTFSGTLSLSYNDGTGGAIASAGLSATGIPATITVGKAYPTNGNWNDYVKNSGGGTSVYDRPDTACTGLETPYFTSCIHGGEKLKVALAGESSCTGMQLYESLGAFDWVCRMVAGTPVFYSQGLKAGKGLIDLLAATSWNNNFVGVNNGSYVIFQSAPAAWWTNPVAGLPANPLSGNAAITLAPVSGTIFTLASSTTSSGYNINQDKVGLVTLGNATLTHSGRTISNCNSTTGEAASPDMRCLISAGAQKFLWIEGLFDATSAGATALEGVFLQGVSFSTVRQLSMKGAKSYGVHFKSVTGSILRDVKVTNCNTGSFGAGGVGVEASEGCLVKDVRAANNQGVGFDIFFSASGSVFQNLIASNNASEGIYLGNGGTGDILTGLTATNNLNTGLSAVSLTGVDVRQLTSVNNGADGIEFYANTNSTLVNVLSANNGTSGLLIHAAESSPILSQLVVTNNSGYGIDTDSVSNGAYYHNLILGNNAVAACNVTASTTSGLINGSCTNSGADGSSAYTGQASTAILRTGRSVASSFVGKLSGEELVNLSDASGAATYATTLDWFGFENPFRAWGKDGSAFPAANSQGPCSSGVCRIWDWSLQYFDTVLKSLVYDGVTPESFIPGSPCPPSVGGNVVLTDQQSTPHTFLVNAVELVGDFDRNPNGNHNGLCETGEACVYSPNFGAYQGEGDLGSRTCTFSNGTVSGVTMYGYPKSAVFSTAGGADISIANGGRELVKSLSTLVNARASISPKSTGKWYFEVQVSTGAGLTNLNVGVGKSTAALSGIILGGDTDGWGFDLSDGKLYNFGTAVFTSGYSAFASGDVVSVAVDLDAGKLWFSDKSGNWLGGYAPNHPVSPATPATSSLGGGIFYPIVGMHLTATAIANFGQKAFVHAVPAGFNPGWFD